ncbi:MAG TPA: extracellular solute-binding protein, partial [Chloroflexota bacterium]|nr:extracellular solute-binding protein [Chloroflexota bacterium]
MHAVRLSRRACLSLVVSGSVGLLAACGGAASATTTGSTSASSSATSAAVTSAAPATTTASPSTVAAATAATLSSAAGTTTAPSASSTSATPSSAAAASAPATQVTVEYWDWWAPTGSPSMTSWWSFIQSDYQAKHPGVKLQLDFLSDFTVYQTRFAGGTYPDAMHTSTAFTYDFWLRGALATLESRVAQTPAVAMDQFLPTAMFYNQAQGHIFGLPMEGPDSEAFIYNTDMFANAGLDPDPNKVAQWTWDEFSQAAQKLTKLD